MSELDDFLTTTVPRQIEAERALHNGDAEPRMEMWAREDPVTVFGTRGPCMSGWDEVSRTFHWVASRYSNSQDFSFEVVAADVSGDLAYTVGYERHSTSLDGGPVESKTLRVTHIYRRENGEWKLVHRHGDDRPVDSKLPV